MSKINSPILRLPIKVDVDKLNSLFEEKEIYNLFREDEATLSLVNSGQGGDPWRDGTTFKVIEDNEEFPFSEGDFTNVNDELRQTYFDKCYQGVRDYINNRTGRVRIFKRVPQSSSSLHCDLDVRLHLALKSDSRSFLIFPELGVFNIPVDGHFYLVDTTIEHFAVNTSYDLDRVHLIIDTYCGFREKRGLEDEIILAAKNLFNEVSMRPGVESC